MGAKVSYEANGDRVVKCGCGTKNYPAGGYDFDCDGCGQAYNCFGQALRPPSEWEEPYDS